MADIQVLCIGGTGESYAGDERREVTGALSQATAVLNTEMFQSEWVGYPAVYGDGLSYKQSLYVGVMNTYDRIIELQGQNGLMPVVLFGYSQGAAVASMMVDLVEAGVIEAPVSGLFTIGSPLYNPLNAVEGIKTKSGAYGISGKGKALPFGVAPETFVADMVAPGDPISEMMPGALLRDIADFTGFMSLSSPKEWADDMKRLIRTQGFQNAGRRGVTTREAVRLLAEAGADLRKYLPYHPFLNFTGGRHTAYTSERAVINGAKKNFTWAAGLGHYLNSIVGAGEW